jgi:hypothetical protein
MDTSCGRILRDEIENQFCAEERNDIAELAELAEN